MLSSVVWIRLDEFLSIGLEVCRIFIVVHVVMYLPHHYGGKWIYSVLCRTIICPLI